jgi:hypothetical protein
MAVSAGKLDAVRYKREIDCLRVIFPPQEEAQSLSKDHRLYVERAMHCGVACPGFSPPKGQFHYSLKGV